MPKLKDKYDVVIIGSGLGGLQCAYIMAKEGKSVCVLEKNAQIGGNLQTFKRDRVKFDTGVHYIGGLEKGQALYPYFKYFNLFDHVDLEKLDVDGYDRISFEGDEISYPHSQGYENFIQQLLIYFPNEEPGIRKYCDEVREICSNFVLYNLDKDFENPDEMRFFGIGAKEVIDSCTENKKLRSVLAGSNMLYAGLGDRSPFYVHALIKDSYIASAYKMKHSDQISNRLRKDIKAMGGEIHINSEVVKINNSPKRAHSVEIVTGEEVKADIFISNVHPSLTFKLMDTESMRRVNVSRMLNLKNTISVFILYINLKPNTHPYSHHNKYHFFQDDVWNLHDYDQDKWVKGMAIFNSRNSPNAKYAHSLTALAYMHYDEVKKWENTFNTTLSESDRDKEYADFKEKKSQEMLSALETVFPNIRDCVESYYSASPLTQRDYIGSIEGGIYGIEHDFKAPLKSFVGTNTKLENLKLTGQNTILHGVLGVTIGSVVTCQSILGKGLIAKIKAASEGEES